MSSGCGAVLPREDRYLNEQYNSAGAKSRVFRFPAAPHSRRTRQNFRRPQRSTNSDFPAGSGAVTSDGHNLSSDASCTGWNRPGDQTDKPAQLGPLADNGGPTLTHLPIVGSPLIDGGQCLPYVPTDQRGVARPFGAKCDIGAVEWTRLLAFLPVVRR